MSAENPGTREGSRGNLIFVRIFIVVLCATAVGTAVWGWRLVGNVRGVAQLTDTRMRTLGWATLSYVSAHEGAFPTSDQELLALRNATGARGGTIRVMNVPAELAWRFDFAGLPYTTA